MLWRAVLVAVGCLLVMWAWAAPAAQGATAGNPSRDGLDRFLASRLDKTGLPGMTVVVTRGSEVVYARGFGSDGHGHRVTQRTQFRIASLSKSFTAVAVLRLVEAGRLDLDSPVQTYLPGFATADPGASLRITVRHLLNQTSGMADAGFPAVADDQPGSAAQRVASLRGAQLVSEPGREFHYFDPNYQVLSRLVEVVAGVPFPTYLRERVLTPLGMTATLTAPTSAEGTRAAERLARGYILLFDVPVARPELDGLLAGSGGVISTADDMGRWLIMQSTGVGPAGHRLLNPTDVELMHTPPPGVDSTYGMGWQVVTPQQGPARIEHNGVLSTFSADQVLLPGSGYAFALLYNGNSALADTAGVKSGLATLLASGSAATDVRRTRTVALLLGGLTLGVLALRTRHLLQLRRWALRRQSRPWWALAPGLAWTLLPAGLLTGIPALVLAITDRSFTFWQLCLAMPDIMIFLAVAASTGAVVVAGRIGMLVQVARSVDGTG